MATRNKRNGEGKLVMNGRKRCPNAAWEQVEQKLRTRGVLATVVADFTVWPMQWCLRLGRDGEVRGTTMDHLAIAAEDWLQRHPTNNA